MNNLKKIREEKGFSLYRLAKEVGTSPRQIQLLEQGKRRLSLDWASRLAKPLQCRPFNIIGINLQEDIEESLQADLENLREKILKENPNVKSKEAVVDFLQYINENIKNLQIESNKEKKELIIKNIQNGNLKETIVIRVVK